MDEIRTDLEGQIRAFAHGLAGQIPVYEYGQVQLRLRSDSPQPSRLHRVVVAVVALIVIVGGVAIYEQQRRTSVTTDARTPVSVRYEKIQYRQHVECDGGEPQADGMFNEATFEAWASPAGRRWRNTVTYPDGSARDLIAEDSPFYPTTIYTRGEIKGARLRCPSDDSTLAAEPGQGSFYSLNPLADLPVSASGEPLVLRCVDMAELIDGNYTDSLGRPAVLRRQRITGFASDGKGGALRPLTQTIDCYLDPTTGRLLEQSFTQSIESLGTAGWTATLIDDSDTSVTNDFFATKDYRATSRPPRPSLDSGERPSTVAGRAPTSSPGTNAPGPTAPGTK